jgi:hypothetical protein
LPAVQEYINGHAIVQTLFLKSLLTSLYQREELPLFGKEGRGEILQSMSILFRDCSYDAAEKVSKRKQKEQPGKGLAGKGLH